jgi:Fe-S cluster assembly ATP-binding protein
MTSANDRTPLLEIQDLRVAVEGKEILRGVNLKVYPGEIHALMGPNGSGKSTLANTLMGHPKYQVLGGRVLLRGEDILDLGPDERARKGMFLAFQYPVAIPGVGMGDFLRAATKSVRANGLSAVEFRKLLREKMELLRVDQTFVRRYVNEGFSGGEKKRAEVLQMAVLQPHAAIMDEPDSGLDIDAVRTVSDGINAIVHSNPEMGLLLITHYQRLLNYVHPHVVQVLINGRIVETGGPELVAVLEAEGYEPILQRLQQEAVA